MECGLCFELYDDQRLIPRNLPCGHTFCEICLNKITQVKGYIECPSCKMKVQDNSISVIDLSKNFVALELALKQRSLQKKLQWCSVHEEFAIFYCEDCFENICAGCISDHSGHRFVKQEHSANLLKERLEKVDVQMKKMCQTINTGIEKVSLEREQFDLKITQKIQEIDDFCNQLISTINIKRNKLKQDLLDMTDGNLQDYDKEQAFNTKVFQSISKTLTAIQKAQTVLCTNNLLYQSSFTYSNRFNKYFCKRIFLQILIFFNIFYFFDHILLENQSVITSEMLVKQVDQIEEEAENHIKIIDSQQSKRTYRFPLVSLNLEVFNTIENLGSIKCKKQEGLICFFGEKNCVLIYEIDKQTWRKEEAKSNNEELEFKQLQQLRPFVLEESDRYNMLFAENQDGSVNGNFLGNNPNQIPPPQEAILRGLNNQLRLPSPQFTSYGAAASISNKILIFGGGKSKQTLQVEFSNDKQSIHMKYLQSMPFCRKEQSAVALSDDTVIIMGGYNQLTEEMLSSCELFSISSNSFTQLASMHIPKCAFAAAVDSSRSFVFTFGGFDSSNRISTIEKYNILQDTWEILHVSLPQPLSNAAAISFKESIFIVGGGHDEGFSHDVFKLNLENNELSAVTQMDAGKDLRNKLVRDGNYLYTIGGNNFQNHRLNLDTLQWETLPSYFPLIVDNLDSWTCAFIECFVEERKEELQLSQGLEQEMLEVQMEQWQKIGLNQPMNSKNGRRGLSTEKQNYPSDERKQVQISQQQEQEHHLRLKQLNQEIIGIPEQVQRRSSARQVNPRLIKQSQSNQSGFPQQQSVPNRNQLIEQNGDLRIFSSKPNPRQQQQQQQSMYSLSRQGNQ